MVELRDGFTKEKALAFPRIIVGKMGEDSLTSMLRVTDIGYYPRAKHYFREREKPINQHIFIYCIDGVRWYHIDDREYTVPANQCFILSAGVPHVYTSDKSHPWTIYRIHFKGILTPFYAREVNHPMDIQPEPHLHIGTRVNLFEGILSTLKSSYSNENLRYAFSMFHFYLGILWYIQQFRDVTANNDVAGDEDVSELAIYCMEEDVEKHPSLQGIADQTEYSPSHSSLLFKKKTDHSSLTYFSLLEAQQSC